MMFRYICLGRNSITEYTSIKRMQSYDQDRKKQENSKRTTRGRTLSTGQLPNHVILDSTSADVTMRQRTS